MTSKKTSTSQKTTRLKDNITEKDFKHLLAYLQADETIRSLRKDRLQKIFSILYSTGIRLNEINQFNEEKITELLQTGKTKIVAHKQNKEKFVYITDKQKKLIQKYWNDDKGYNIVSERANKKDHLTVPGTIRDVNSYLKKVFPHKNYTSHSFRQTLITDLANKGINPKVIQTLIGHKNVQTTLNYIKPSEEDILNSLETVRG